MYLCSYWLSILPLPTMFGILFWNCSDSVGICFSFCFLYPVSINNDKVLIETTIELLLPRQ